MQEVILKISFMISIIMFTSRLGREES